jgi:hypothetical protein
MWWLYTIADRILSIGSFFVRKLCAQARLAQYELLNETEDARREASINKSRREVSILRLSLFSNPNRSNISLGISI